MGEKCGCERTHWVVHASKRSNCWDCMNDPCACSPLLVWDEKEKASNCFFLSCNGKNEKIWMTKPIVYIPTINYKREEKKRKERIEKEREEENCAKNQQSAQNYS
jgi:hypothetical protein